MIAKEGRIILIPLLFITFPIGVYAHASGNKLLIILYTALGLLFLFCLNFFRDPVRSIPVDKTIVVSPADGKVVRIEEIDDPDLGGPARLVSIFLNVFNVHVNRVPFTAKVSDFAHKSGNFIAAYDHKASDENERTNILFSTKYFNYRVMQIAGLIARRIHCYAEVDKEMKKGDRLGFIMFGSRTDIIFPSSMEIRVAIGEKVKGGKTIIGKIS